MKNSKLLMAIARGLWMMDKNYSDSYIPIVIQLYKGEDVRLEERKPLSVVSVGINSLTQGISKDTDFENVPKGSVAVMPLKGVMLKYGTWCEWGTTEIAPYLYKAAESKNIEGAVIDIDTGGGAIDSIPPLLEAIAYMQSKDKPVVAIGDLVASAGMYVAAHCDYVMADNNVSSMFGSIGTMVSWYDYRGMLEKEGIKLIEIYPPESFAKNKEWRDAQDDNVETMIKNILSPHAVKFQEAMKAARGDKLDMSVKGLLNGRLFFAEEAMTAGLIDEIGSIDRAVEVVLDKREAKKFINT